MNNLTLHQRSIIIDAASKEIGFDLAKIDKDEVNIIVPIFIATLGNFDVEFRKETREGKQIWMPVQVFDRNEG